MNGKEIIRRVKNKQTAMGAIILSLILSIAALSFATVVPEAVGAFDPQYEPQQAQTTSFTYMKMVSINGEFIEDDLDGFPILVHDDTGNLLGNVLANGSDIAFFDINKTVQYPHEIEEYNSATGELWAWVNISHLSESVGATIRMYYGDADGGYTIGYNPTNVWDQNYTAVYHLNESSGSTVTDSTANGNDAVYNGSNFPSRTYGKAAGGQHFNGANGTYIDLPPAVGINVLGSIELFVNPDTTDRAYLYTCSDNAQTSYHVIDLYEPAPQSSEDVMVATGANPWVFGSGPVNFYAGSWIYLGHAHQEDPDDMVLMQNSTIQYNTVSFAAIDKFDAGAGQNHVLGMNKNTNNKLNGTMDEVRLSNSRRSNEWLNATFNSVNLTDGFLTLGPQIEQAVPSNFQYYKLITIESDFITGDLVNFPMLIHDSTGDLQGKVLSNGSDIAFFNATNETQYNHEIEYYNSSNGELWAWVAIVNLPSATDTFLYMYYGDSDGGYSVGHSPKNTWDQNYYGVYHMNQSTGSTCFDSSIYGNDGTYQNSLPNRNESKVSYGQYFDLSQDDNVSLPAGAFLSKQGTVECWYDTQIASGEKQYLYYSRNSDNTDYWILIEAEAGNNYEFDVIRDSAPVVNVQTGTRAVGWHYHAGAAAADNDYEDATLFINGSSIGTDDDYSLDAMTTTGSYIGSNNWHGHQCANGQIDEFRISNTRRSDSWLGATFNSTNQSTGFVTLGNEVQNFVATTLNLYGLDGADNNITWSGTVAETVWSNATQPGGTAELNMTINSTDNITEIRVYCDDLDASILASNITMYISSDNSSFGSLGAFTDGGSNISINTTTWPGGAGTNPFTYGGGAGLTTTNTSIYFRFTLTLGNTAGEYTQEDWAMYLGYYG